MRYSSPTRSAASTPLYRDSLPWKFFIDRFHQRYGNDALLTLDSFWGEFYQADGTRDDERPTTMLHIKDIVHRWILHLNKFAPWVRERDDLLSEIAQYVEPRVNESCFRAWQNRRAECVDACMGYMTDLLGFAHHSQWFLVRKPFLGDVKEPSNAEFSRHHFSIRDNPSTVQISQNEYQRCMEQLNGHRDRYSGHWDRAIQKLQEDME